MKPLRQAITILILLSFWQCSLMEDSEGRRSGDGTISCYINGRLWQNSAGSNMTGGVSSESMSFYTDSVPKHFCFLGRKWKDSKLYLMMIESKFDASNGYILDDSQGVVDYPLDMKVYNTMVFFNENGKYLSKSGEGWIRKVEFLNDTITGERRYKGTFEAVLYNENDSTDVLHITDGRFDRHILGEE